YCIVGIAVEDVISVVSSDLHSWVTVFVLIVTEE
ncbi:GSCOCG00010737001-RA-CDS, partial [Cotesia congregata]